MDINLGSPEVVTFSTLALETPLSILWSMWMRQWEMEGRILDLSGMEGHRMAVRELGIVLATNSLWNCRQFLRDSVFSSLINKMTR